jgi:hypothetical protein
MSGLPATYEIGYAYPSSETANKLRRPDGCYFYRAGQDLKAFDAAADAEEHAKAGGLAPSRFSIDHPLNAKYRANFGPVKASS